VFTKALQSVPQPLAANKVPAQSAMMKSDTSVGLGEAKTHLRKE
jgi:hypothetical protein